MKAQGFEKQYNTCWTKTEMEPEMLPFLLNAFFVLFEKPGAYITHNATEWHRLDYLIIFSSFNSYHGMLTLL